MSENLQKILEIFYQICKIPHPSGQTSELKAFLIDFLRACACEVKTDSTGNIYALKGAPKVVLQAHYDMVLVGEEVVPVIEGEFLKSRNSSLGADNGIAVATILHLAKTRKNIEILLTNDEEIGMLGAKNLALKTRSKVMVNLDSECVNEICVGCAGGFDVDIDLGNLVLGAGNSPLDLHSADLVNFGEQQTASLVVSPKFTTHRVVKQKNHESQTENPSVVDSALAQNLGENNPSLRADSQNLHCNPPIENIAESQGGLPREQSSLAMTDFNGLPRRFCESARNDEMESLRDDEFALDSAFYEFSAYNFKGGHSGIDIDKNIKNAIVELLFALDSARKMGEFEILEISGGEARNSIPINARAVIATKSPIDFTRTADSAPHIAIKKLASYTPKQKALKSAVVAHLLRLHNGIYEVQEGSVTSSLNFSQISQKELKIMVRGNRAEFLERQILRLKYLFGEAVKISGFYNAWEANSSCGVVLGSASARFVNESKNSISSLASHNPKNSSTILEFASCDENAESTLLNAVSHIYQKHKIPFKVVQIHAGLECGILKEKCGLDEVVSIGPTILHPHSKNETLNLPSVGQIYEILADLVG